MKYCKDSVCTYFVLLSNSGLLIFPCKRKGSILYLGVLNWLAPLLFMLGATINENQDHLNSSTAVS